MTRDELTYLLSARGHLLTPEDLVPAELADWLGGLLKLDDVSKLHWWQDQKARMAILSAQLADQLRAEAAWADLR